MDNFSKENFTINDMAEQIISLGEENEELKETISDLQKTIDLLLKERQSICPYPFKYASEMPKPSERLHPSEMPGWFKKGFKE